MEFWFLIFTSLCLSASLLSLVSLLSSKNKKLPPGPPTLPIFGNIFWLLKSSRNFSDIEPVLHQLRQNYGPIVTFHIGSRPAIFITTANAAHKMLVKNATLFADRPSSVATKILFSNQRTITTAPYGSLWRSLRGNLLSITQPSRLKYYSDGRRWAFSSLKNRLVDEIKLGKPVPINDCVQFSIFALLCYMCFGEKFDDETIKEIEAAAQAIISNFIRFNVLNFMPKLGKVLFRNLWKELLQICQNQVNAILPHIKARRAKLNEEEQEREHNIFYIDTLLAARDPESGGGFTDDEMVSLAMEFLIGGTDTMKSTLQWTMANIVKHQYIQQKLFDEITQWVSPGEEIEEEDLGKMGYLNAVILETLRRHPPAHFILPRTVIEETVFDGYYIPKGAMVNFTVAEMGRDQDVWEDPLEFRPERFMVDEGEGVVDFDLKGVREIKMMPFGAGRRICPAIGFALLHMKFIVANLVRDFKLLKVDGCEVDMSEKQVFTIVMKNPLMSTLCPRT